MIVNVIEQNEVVFCTTAHDSVYVPTVLGMIISSSRVVVPFDATSPPVKLEVLTLCRLVPLMNLNSTIASSHVSKLVFLTVHTRSTYNWPGVYWLLFTGDRDTVEHAPDVVYVAVAVGVFVPLGVAVLVGRGVGPGV